MLNSVTLVGRLTRDPELRHTNKDLLARTTGSYVLVGHSLGARVMATTTETLASAPQAPSIEVLHLLGAAINAKGDRRALNDAVTDSVYNYYSSRDDVLNRAYKAVQGGQTAAGARGFKSKFPRIKDRDVSRRVATHSDYFGHVKLA